MSAALKFTIPGEPQGKARPRVLRSGHAYTPQKTVEYERRVQAAFAMCGGHAFPKGVPLCVIIIAYFAPPKSIKGARRISMIKGEIHPTKKPDSDNIAKCVLDALNGLAYHDDSQVAILVVRKRYAEHPRVDVEILEITSYSGCCIEDESS